MEGYIPAVDGQSLDKDEDEVASFVKEEELAELVQYLLCCAAPQPS